MNMNTKQQVWRDLAARTAQLGVAGFLLACSAGLFYVAYLAWVTTSAASPDGPRGLPLFGFATALAAGGAVLLKRAVRPPPAEAEWA